jgi:uncharacterized protein
VRSFFIICNNMLTRWRKIRVLPQNLLLLVPHCIQFTACGQNVLRDLNQCRHCGQCDVTDLLELRQRYGILCSMAGGGRQALELLRSREVEAVVAVACEKELVEGILASFPKPVLAVPNFRPKGPCKDTRVDMPAVESAIKEMLILPTELLMAQAAAVTNSA